jgi:hypothetical protein
MSLHNHYSDSVIEMQVFLYLFDQYLTDSTFSGARLLPGFKLGIQYSHEHSPDPH